MIAEDRNKPTTFRADRWRFARKKTGEWLMPILASVAGQIAMAIAIPVVGALIFGMAHFIAEYEVAAASVVTLEVLAFVFIFSFIVMLGLNYLRAPAAMWRRDQGIISDLREQLRPVMSLSFNQAECVRNLPRGAFVDSRGGVRWLDTKDTDRHYLVKCKSNTSVLITGVEVYVVDVKRSDLTNGAQIYNVFCDPVRVFPVTGDLGAGSSIPPEPGRFFSVVIHPSAFTMPRINAQIPFAYQSLFYHSGIYEITIKAYAPNSVEVSIVLEMMLHRDEQSGATSGAYARYEIVWVRQKTKTL